VSSPEAWGQGVRVSTEAEPAEQALLQPEAKPGEPELLQPEAEPEVLQPEAERARVPVPAAGLRWRPAGLASMHC
jgi:hypothetical protein